MTNRIPSIVFFAGSLCLVLLIYLPALNGPPIWDDITHWFLDPVMQKSFPFSVILRDFNWPVSVFVQKITFGLWGYSFFNYHILNLAIHFSCACLLYRIAILLKFDRPGWLFALFLFHPANVISVAWMIQLKTLLCGFFCGLSFLILIRALPDKRWMPLSWLFFLLSVLSKSASLPFSLIFILFAFQRDKSRKNLFWMVPFLLISALGTYRLLRSEVTQKAAILVEERIIAPPVQIKKEIPPTVVPPTDIPTISTHPMILRLTRILRTGRYYVLKSLFPFDNEPIKAKYTGNLSFLDYLFFFSLLGMIWFMKRQGLSLICGLIGMSIFLGYFSAPYMNVTLVSDQHMYLLLPFLLVHWMAFSGKLLHLTGRREKTSIFTRTAGSLIIVLFMFLSNEASHYYSDELIFYQASYEADPTNVPLLHNLTATYMVRGKKKEAYELLKNMRETEDMKNDPFYQDIVELRQSLESQLSH